MFEEKIEVLNHSRASGTGKKKTVVTETEKSESSPQRIYTPPKQNSGNNGMQSIDLNLLVRALQTVMYGDQEDYQSIDPSRVQVYTVEEIQTMLGVSRVAVYELLKKKEFPSIKVGNGWKIPKKSFHEWLNSGR